MRSKRPLDLYFWSWVPTIRPASQIFSDNVFLPARLWPIRFNEPCSAEIDGLGFCSLDYRFEWGLFPDSITLKSETSGPLSLATKKTNHLIQVTPRQVCDFMVDWIRQLLILVELLSTSFRFHISSAVRMKWQNFWWVQLPFFKCFGLDVRNGIWIFSSSDPMVVNRPQRILESFSNYLIFSDPLF